VRLAAIAHDVLREARSRRWVLALAAGTTLLIVLAALGLELEVVDGALAASRFFGSPFRHDIRPADVALQPLFEGISYVVFYGGIVLGVLSCADFAPALLAPGRVEHLLSLPVRRAEIVVGVFLGVEALVLCGALYGGVGLSLVIWVKTGVLGWGPVASAACAAVGFTGVYAAMTLSAVLVRSAALSGVAGGLVFLAGVVAGYRIELAPLFSAGPSRAAFLVVTAPLPRLSTLSSVGDRVAAAAQLQLAPVVALMGGTLSFALALLVIAVVVFERRDF
jgi:ABC-2 type transport system permease protein